MIIKKTVCDFCHGSEGTLYVSEINDCTIVRDDENSDLINDIMWCDNCKETIEGLKK